jgi:mRNA interferase MazF
MKSIRQLLQSAKSSSAKVPYCPDKGDIIWIDFDPQAGREMAGRHAALVVSPLKYNQFARLCIIFPITGQVKGWNFEVLLPPDFKIPGGSKQGGAVVADQIKSHSWKDRNCDFACRAPEGILEHVMAKCVTLLPLPDR